MRKNWESKKKSQFWVNVGRFRKEENWRKAKKIKGDFEKKEGR